MKENIKMAFSSILSNKMRSLLTMLGIIIGTAAVIAILSVGNGATNDISGTLDRVIGTTVSISVDETKAESSDYITIQDIEKIREIEFVKYVSPNISKSSMVTSDDKTGMAMIYCGTPDMQFTSQLASDELLAGTYFTKSQYENAQAVAVIDEETAKALFNTSDVVGKTIRIGTSGAKQNVKIVGVLKSLTSMLTNGDESRSDRFDIEITNAPLFVYIPVTFAETLFNEDININGLNIKITESDEIETVSKSTTQLLEKRHNQRGSGMYQATSLNMTDQINQIMNLIISFIAIVAAISLLVGGIGVMNIMLVSVTERTREIGIRKAIGASTQAILFQFLTESVVISLLGGLIGLVFGLVSAEFLSAYLGVLPNIGADTILLVIAYSLAIGIFFGAYPAKKAANLDPIEALRYD